MKRATYIKPFLITVLLALYSISYSQQSNVKFNKTVHDFGDIMLNSGHHSCNFSFKNISNQPVVIQTVISSCGCAQPKWTKQPIMPNESGNISVTFLNDQGPYPFDKSLTVYITGEPKPIILRLKGVVHKKLKSLSELFPENYNGLSFRKSYIDFGSIAKDNVNSLVIEVANTSNKKIEVTFTNLKEGLSIKPNPIVIEANKRDNLVFTIDTYKTKEWGKSTFSNDITVNGKKVNDKELKIYASIRDNFSNLTKEEKNSAPLPMAGSSSYNFGEIKQGDLVKTSFRVRNLGRRDLLIRKVESELSNINAKYPNIIAPRETGVIEITVNTSEKIGEQTFLVSVISNSPSRPVMNFVLTGHIVQ
ncbi:MAG: DUF1573 domain-containing protein [Bacteroidales bacterium]|nr:DUF1573 domain-containing protein [Bacteroidales bacterium]MDD4655846.1 DUF1573 domain-containing protein [Bacteroidales bacterium]